MAKGYEIANVMGIPVKVHFTLLVFFPFFLLQMMEAGLPFFAAALGVILLFGSVALHELGHSAAAHHYRYRVREIVLYPIGGIAMLESLPAKPIEELVIAIAGPLVSLMLSVTGFILMAVTGSLGLRTLWMLSMILAGVNAMLFLFNLIPSFPMDGGRVFRALMTPSKGRLKATELAMKVGRFFAMLFGIFGLLGIPGVMGPSFMLVIIGVFIYFMAGAEYRMILLQDGMRHMTPFGMNPQPARREDDHHFTVSPPPYEADPLKKASGKIRHWFEALSKDYDA